MHDLVYQLKRLAERNRDGSLKTQYDRKHMLMLCGEQLVELGYKTLQATEFKGRHVTKLVRRWQAEGISAGTLANRLAALRWWAEKIGRPGVLAKSNAVYGIVPRQRVSEESKAKVLSEEQLAQVTDSYVRMSLRLILAFGLRRKESLMIHVHEADQDDRLVLQHNWTKNGLARTIPIVCQAQRDTLDAAKAFITKTSSSMIPDDLMYIEQRHKFDWWIQKIGLGGGHGLRHSWAQQRYQQLAQFPCPHRGGPLWVEMTVEQQQADIEARTILSQEMGHFRSHVVDIYIGKNT